MWYCKMGYKLPQNKCNKLRRINARHRDVRTHTINHEREQQKDEPATQVSVLVGFG